MKKAILLLSIAGLAFSGYLSGVKFFSKTCAFNESCPYFLGYPACYFGFVMYVILAILAFMLVRGRADAHKVLNGIILVSGVGILFAGYFTVGELPTLFRDGFSAYFFGLPTCALGLIFYIAIFVIALMRRARQ